MTDYQYKQLFDKLTELLDGIERVKAIMKESRADAFEVSSNSEPPKLLNNAVIADSESDRVKLNS